MKRFYVKNLNNANTSKTTRPYQKHGAAGEYATGNYKGTSNIAKAKEFKSYKAAEKWVVENTTAPLIPDTRPGKQGHFLPHGNGPITEFEIVEVDFTPVIVANTPRTVTFGTNTYSSNVGSIDMVEGR